MTPKNGGKCRIDLGRLVMYHTTYLPQFQMQNLTTPNKMGSSQVQLRYNKLLMTCCAILYCQCVNHFLLYTIFKSKKKMFWLQIVSVCTVKSFFQFCMVQCRVKTPVRLFFVVVCVPLRGISLHFLPHKCNRKLKEISQKEGILPLRQMCQKRMSPLEDFPFTF